MNSILDTPEMAGLLTLVEEAARSTEEGVKHCVEPAPGTLQRTTTRRHHIVFGRRGSGKSSLLRKAAADLTFDRRPIASVNLEAFKGHSYPDVLISVLISTLTEFQTWMETAAVHPATRTTFWELGSAPNRPSFNRAKSAELSKQFKTQIDALEKELHRTDDTEVRVTDGAETSQNDSAGIKVSAASPIAGVEGQVARPPARGHRSRRWKRDSNGQRPISCIGTFSTSSVFSPHWVIFRRGCLPVPRRPLPHSTL